MSKVKKSTHSSEDFSSSSASSSSLSSDEEVDARDLKPIKEYLSDRRELARQLFKSVKAEKIQMMLPQALKNMDLIQLENWCASELSGMSKTRILCILNGKPLLESSDTSESDDSGPSLEIISDTEEWFTDEDICKQEEGSKMLKGKMKKDRTKQKGKSQINKKIDIKCNPKKVPDNIYKNVQVKKEEDVNKNKEKEGDSLLDLLELEMRARAIRALIRKEEDIIPSASKSTKGNNTIEKAATKAEQDEIKEKENCRRQLERIISAQQSTTAEDEDVVLVVQPTPTIELLSSDSEGEPHGGVRVNKKLQNERVIETKDSIDRIENKDANSVVHSANSVVHSANSTNNSIEGEVTKSTTKTRKEIDTTNKGEIDKHTHNNNVSHKDGHKRRKAKKKSYTKEQSKSIASEGAAGSNDNQSEKMIKREEHSSEKVKLDDKDHKDSVKSQVAGNHSSSKKQDSTRSSVADKRALDEEKSIDLDEIIDLDDYGDDMDDMENNENDKNKTDKNKTDQAAESNECKSRTEVQSSRKPNGTETWASRYYQTDDVQNVIKESKIQSEIRKRLRERQRLSKLSTSPNKNSPSSPPTVEAANNTIADKDPMGSVDEYLALKHTATANLGASNSNNDTSTNDDNSASTDTCTHMNSPIGKDDASAACSKIQKIDKGIAVNDNTSVNNLVTAKNGNAINAIDIPNPS